MATRVASELINEIIFTLYLTEDQDLKWRPDTNTLEQSPYYHTPVYHPSSDWLQPQLHGEALFLSSSYSSNQLSLDCSQHNCLQHFFSMAAVPQVQSKARASSGLQRLTTRYKKYCHLESVGIDCQQLHL